MRIELIRHGETALQTERRYQGVTDAHLSERGRDALCPAEKRPAMVYVSPLLRARETAAILFPEAEQIVIPDLREMNFGIFENRSATEMEHDPAYRAWVDGMCLSTCPGGESKQEFCSRVCTAFSALIEQAEAKGLAAVTFVAHGGTQMAVMERYSHEDRPYWQWQLPSGHGYLLETKNWAEEPRLRVIDVLDFTRHCAKA